ncbi:hypothetical protein [Bacteriovorax sp. Seq25_V]|uniref:DUF6901 family protein n=1 Tax=Bacteriovorax sp. Seq25_V TaxID=1201288 RepID=UPI00038A09B6|nr:hypothetical protein [Bacteriovorax sp. Seq25_V]EQC44174.1 hypothetical protein M900_A0496 [Bacteriovorax sp. Seq25_V]
MNTRQFRYKFTFESGTQFEYQVNLDEQLHSHTNIEEISNFIEVCDLKYCQCPNCPLTKEESALCPSAVAISRLIPEFEKMNSYERCSVHVLTENREYTKECDIQHGLQSLFGLVLATSGCPRMEFLRSMAKFHLPFSNSEETIVRALSFYLLSKFAKDPTLRDFTIEDLKNNYEELSIVNAALCERISSLEKLDASKNALIVLDTFSQMFKVEFELDFEDISDYIS